MEPHENTGTLVDKDREETFGNDKVNITFYTDPLCCWCWAFEQHWQLFVDTFQHSIEWKYCLGGMIRSWEEFSDPLNMVNKPAQMGPVWMEARYITGQPINEMIWATDPPDSSFPACIAIKTAALQSEAAGKAMLHALQKAVITDCVNIAKHENLLQLAGKLNKVREDFSYEKFLTDFNNEASRDALRADLQKARYAGIGRFPTLTMTRASKPGIIITGYRPYEVLLNAFSRMAPEFFKPINNN